MTFKITKVFYGGLIKDKKWQLTERKAAFIEGVRPFQNLLLYRFNLKSPDTTICCCFTIYFYNTIFNT